MPRGGRRERSGRKLKWEERQAEIGVPASISNDLVAAIEYLWENGVRGQDCVDALRSIRFRKVKKYDYPVSAGAHSTSSVGGDSLNTNYEVMDLYEALISDPSKTSIMPVTGDSMIGIGIFPGDWLIVEEIHPLFETPKEGDIVVVSVDDETLVKCYERENGEVVLTSKNDEHEPIRRSDGSIYVTGIVRNAIRRNLSKL